MIDALGVPVELRGRASRLLAIQFLSSAALALLKAVQTGVFLGACDRSVIPWAFAASAGCLSLASTLTVRLGQRLGPAGQATAVLAVCTALLVPVGLAVHGGVGPFAVYVALETVAGLVIVQTWSVVSLACNARSARQLLPMASLGSGLAWTVGGLAVPWLVDHTGVPALVAASTLLMGATVGVVNEVRRSDLTIARREARTADEGLGGAFALVLRSEMLSLVLGLSIGALVVEQVMDYLMLGIAQEHLDGDPHAIASFFGAYFGITSALTTVAGLLLTGPVLSRLGPSRSLLVTPAVALVFAAALVASPGLALATGLRCVYRFLKRAVFSTALEQMQVALPAAERIQAKALNRGVVGPLGYGVAALALAALPIGFEPRALAALLVVLLFAMAAIVAWRTRVAYTSALQRAIDDRRLDLEARPRDQRLDAETCAALARALSEPDAARAALAVEMLAEDPSPQARAALTIGLRHAAADVRAATVRALGPSAAPVLATLVDDPSPDVRAAVVDEIAQSTSPAVEPALARATSDPDAATRARAIMAVLSRRSPDEVAGGSALLAAAGDAEREAAAVRALGRSAVERADVRVRLADLVARGEDPTCQAALAAVARLGLVDAVPAIVGLLDRPRRAESAAEHLAVIGAPAFPSLTAWSTGADRPSPIGVRCVATAFAPHGADPVFGALLSHRLPEVREQTVRALAGARRAGTSRVAASVVDNALHTELRDAWTVGAALAGLRAAGVADDADGPGSFLARETSLRFDAARWRVIGLLVAGGATSLAGAHDVGRRRGGADMEARVAELVEMVAARHLVPRVVPLFDPTADRVDLARTIAGVEGGWTRLIDGLGDEHLAACAMLATSPGSLTADMVSVLERLQFLRSVPLFASLPAEDLRGIAAIVEPVAFEAGDDVLHKGEFGAELFVIVRGAVRIHDAKVDLARLGPREFFGELAVLDQEPRMADATALEPTVLLRLRGPDLEELMARRPQISEAIVQVLVRRLRDVTRRVH